MMLANPNPYVTSEVSLFTDLVKVGEEKTHATLPDHLRSFLVYCLIEHLEDPDIVWHVLALDFLEAEHKSGAVRAAALKRAGDASLILAGLFPERALRLRVSADYFRMMGQSFYGSLAVQLEVTALAEQGQFYNEVAREFALLERVLNGARGKAQNEWLAFLRFKAQLN